MAKDRLKEWGFKDVERSGVGIVRRREHGKKGCRHSANGRVCGKGYERML